MIVLRVWKFHKAGIGTVHALQAHSKLGMFAGLDDPGACSVEAHAVSNQRQKDYLLTTSHI